MRLWTCSACWTGARSIVPPLVITFLITLLTVFNVVELLVAHIDLGVFNENVPLNIFPTVAGNRRRYLGCAKEGKRGDQRLETTPAVVCLLRQPMTYVRYILADNAVRTTLSVQRGQDFASMKLIRDGSYSLPIASNTSSISF